MPNNLYHNGKLCKIAGYAALIERYSLNVVDIWHESAVSSSLTHKVDTIGGMVREIFPASHWPGESFGDHLEFALKYDGVNLAVLSQLFAVASPQELTAYVTSKSLGKYARRAWYLYELLTGGRLAIDDLKKGNYIDLLDRDNYYTGKSRRVRRQRINNNLLGDSRFCPMVRRTKTLENFAQAELGNRCRQVMAAYPHGLLKRALNYLYTKETKSSFEIEHITPSATRTERFVALLQLAEREDFFDKQALVDLQNRTVDERFRDRGFRSNQNYVGQSIAWHREKIHYVSPKPEDLSDMMAGMFTAHVRMQEGEVHPVVHAAAVAFGFVFMHPFEDGNGRIHRFLIHNILARRGFTPEGVIFPVSAAMLKNTDAYDAALEAFSRPLMLLVDYSLDDEGRMTVQNDTAGYYRYIDMTAQAEALFGFIQTTIESEFVEELNFLQNYDITKQALQEIVDMPDRLIDLFIHFCLQNNGTLSNPKRKSHFQNLTDEEVRQMEDAIRKTYRK